MNAIPAKIAGVARLAMTVPAPRGVLDPLVLAAAEIAGVDEIYRIGGAQAVGALAYGTETVAPVDKIVGPGNVFVAAAKRQVFGRVGIDTIAGPSEILIVADRDNDPTWIAADLLAQAEHDTAAQAILMTVDGDFAGGRRGGHRRPSEPAPPGRRGGGKLADLRRRRAVARSGGGASPHRPNRAGTPGPGRGRARCPRRPHPQRRGRVPWEPGHRRRWATTWPAPTTCCPPPAAPASPRASAVLDFVKRTSLIGADARALAAVGPAAVTLARAEGLDAHALSISVRLAED